MEAGPQLVPVLPGPVRLDPGCVRWPARRSSPFPQLLFRLPSDNCYELHPDFGARSPPPTSAVRPGSHPWAERPRRLGVQKSCCSAKTRIFRSRVIAPLRLRPARDGPPAHLGGPGPSARRRHLRFLVCVVSTTGSAGLGMRYWIASPEKTTFTSPSTSQGAGNTGERCMSGHVPALSRHSAGYEAC